MCLGYPGLCEFGTWFSLVIAGKWWYPSTQLLWQVEETLLSSLVVMVPTSSTGGQHKGLAYGSTIRWRLELETKAKWTFEMGSTVVWLERSCSAHRVYERICRKSSYQRSRTCPRTWGRRKGEVLASKLKINQIRCQEMHASGLPMLQMAPRQSKMEAHTSIKEFVLQNSSHFIMRGSGLGQCKKFQDYFRIHCAFSVNERFT